MKKVKRITFNKIANDKILNKSNNNQIKEEIKSKEKSIKYDKNMNKSFKEYLKSKENLIKSQKEIQKKKIEIEKEKK